MAERKSGEALIETEAMRQDPETASADVFRSLMREDRVFPPQP